MRLTRKQTGILLTKRKSVWLVYQAGLLDPAPFPIAAYDNAMEPAQHIEEFIRRGGNPEERYVGTFILDGMLFLEDMNPLATDEEFKEKYGGRR